MVHGALREEFGLEKNKYKKYLIMKIVITSFIVKKKSYISLFSVFWEQITAGSELYKITEKYSNNSVGSHLFGF